jgi:hypothetical protein
VAGAPPGPCAEPAGPSASLGGLRRGRIRRAGSASAAAHAAHQAPGLASGFHLGQYRRPRSQLAARNGEIQSLHCYFTSFGDYGGGLALGSIANPGHHSFSEQGTARRAEKGVGTSRGQGSLQASDNAGCLAVGTPIDMDGTALYWAGQAHLKGFTPPCEGVSEEPWSRWPQQGSPNCSRCPTPRRTV